MVERGRIKIADPDDLALIACHRLAPSVTAKPVRPDQRGTILTAGRIRPAGNKRPRGGPSGREGTLTEGTTIHGERSKAERKLDSGATLRKVFVIKKWRRVQGREETANRRGRAALTRDRPTQRHSVEGPTRSTGNLSAARFRARRAAAQQFAQDAPSFTQTRGTSAAPEEKNPRDIFLLPAIPWR